MIAQTIKLLFTCYTALLFIRVIGSWFPQFRYHNFMRFVAHYTDPYLNLFRRVVPPIGGMIDISPILGFFFLQILEKVVLTFIR